MVERSGTRTRPGMGGLFAPREGQALLETAIVLPLLFFLVFAVIGVGRLTRAQMAVSAVAREAARTGALANTATEARSQGLSKGRELAVTSGLATENLTLSLDLGTFTPGSPVVANASYRLSFGDLPLLGWASITVRSEHRERVDLYRSRRAGGNE